MLLMFQPPLNVMLVVNLRQINFITLRKFPSIPVLFASSSLTVCSMASFLFCIHWYTFYTFYSLMCFLSTLIDCSDIDLFILKENPCLFFLYTVEFRLLFFLFIPYWLVIIIPYFNFDTKSFQSATCLNSGQILLLFCALSLVSFLLLLACFVREQIFLYFHF